MAKAPERGNPQSVDAITHRLGEEFNGAYQGAVAFDSTWRIAYVTPATEKFLGWGNKEIIGMRCHAIFGCQNTIGESLCSRCGLTAALADGEDHVGMLARVKDRAGHRHEVNYSFLYLDPRRCSGARVIGVFRALASLPHLLPRGAASATDSDGRRALGQG